MKNELKTFLTKKLLDGFSCLAYAQTIISLLNKKNISLKDFREFPRATSTSFLIEVYKEVTELDEIEQ